MWMEMPSVTPKQGVQRSRIPMFFLALCWHLLHLLINMVDFSFNIANNLHCYLISSGLWTKYESLQLNKLKYLATVIDSDEAVNISQVSKVLRWLSIIGVEHVSLYDAEGMLKESKKILVQSLNELGIRAWESNVQEAENEAVFRDRKRSRLELLSLSDGKEGVAKAVRFLCSNDLSSVNCDVQQTERIFKEADIDRGLRAVGCGGPEPDLLLIFGDARCHLGFPAWRLRYTEIVYMGKLKSATFGAIVKVIEEFTRKHQNYGS